MGVQGVIYICKCTCAMGKLGHNYYSFGSIKWEELSVNHFSEFCNPRNGQKNGFF